jgi:hypothetical protein
MCEATALHTRTAVGSVEGTLFDLARSDSEDQQGKRVPRKQATEGQRTSDDQQ